MVMVDGAEHWLGGTWWMGKMLEKEEEWEIERSCM